MQILSISLTNIKSHRNTELSFLSGINVLAGMNGAGKSTIFEAIGYALFGVDAQDFVSNVSRFISIGAKSGRISVVFQTDEGDVWKVTRTVGTPSKWLLAKKSGDDFEVEEHARIEETAVRIAGLLGLANGRPLSEQFKLVIGPFQNEFLGPFIIRQSAKRQEAFDEILGIDTWRKTFKGTLSLSSAVQSKISIIRVEIEGLEQQLLNLPGKEKDFSVAGKVLIEKQRELSEKESLLRQMESMLEDLEKKKNAIEALSTSIEKLESRIKDGDDKIAAQKRMVEEAELALKVVNESRIGKEKFEKAEMLLNELRKKEEERRRLEQELVGLERETQRLSLNVEHDQADIQKIDKALDDDEAMLSRTRKELLEKGKLTRNTISLQKLRLDSDIIKAERSLQEGRLDGLAEGRKKLEKGLCPFFQEQCRNIEGTVPQDLFSAKTSDLKRAIAKLDIQISEVDREVKATEEAEKESHTDSVRLQELERQIASIKDRRQKNQDALEPLEQLKKRYLDAMMQVESKKKELKAYEMLDEKVRKEEGQRRSFQAARDAFEINLKVGNDLENRRKTLAQWEIGLDGLKRDLALRNTEIGNCRENYQHQQHNELRKERDDALSDVARYRQHILDMGNTIERLEKEVKELKMIEVVSSQKKSVIKKLEEKDRLVKFLRNQVFKNVSTQLSERFREEITLRADIIYRSISESDEELLWGDNYQIILRDMVDGSVRERSDDQLSGGQTMSAVVALRLALLQTIGARIAFFDEPTSNLDASRRENLANAFRAIDVGREDITEHWYDQLFLISHDVAFTEITDQVIQIGD